MATFHFKLLENFLEVQVQNTVWALRLQPLWFYFAYLFQCTCSFGSNLQITPTPRHKWWGGAEWTCAEVVKTCGAEVKAWVASVIWWCLAKNQTLEQLYQNNVDPNLVKKWFPSWKCWTSIKRFYKIPTQQKTNRTNTTGCSLTYLLTYFNHTSTLEIGTYKIHTFWHTGSRVNYIWICTIFLFFSCYFLLFFFPIPFGIVLRLCLWVCARFHDCW